MMHTVRRTMLTVIISAALSLAGAFVAASANAATISAPSGPATTHAVTAVSHAPNSLGFCFTHWQDNNGNDLPYATYTCLVTSDSVWQGFAQCTNDDVYFTREHVGAGNDQINCPRGYVVFNAGVNFLN